MARIVFPEYSNKVIEEAISGANIDFEAASVEFKAVKAEGLAEALQILADGGADAMIAGIDYTTRDVILASRDIVGASGKTFSSCVYCEKEGSSPLILADVGVTKEADAERMTDIVLQAYETASRLLDEEPRVAMLSFSTKGSARDASIEKIQEVIRKVLEVAPSMKIDGEMQLDAAVVPRVAERKMPDSEVAGRANVLITPDLNSGNILYKSLEQFGGYTIAGPILQGFNKPISDLSRGSTVEDVKLVIKVMGKLVG